jgi:IS1 family transposase
VANHMKAEKRVQLLRLLAEGNSVRSTARLLETNIRTVLRHLVLAGEECRQFLHANLVEIKAGHVQLDEQWTYCGKHQRRLSPEQQSDASLGDQFLFIALDTASKLICTYAIGKRDMETTERFLDDLSRRIVLPTREEVVAGRAVRPQVSSDAFHSYYGGMDQTFGRQVGYGQLIKKYHENREAGRYSPAGIIGVDRRPMWGAIDPMTICTSHVERFNGSTRQWCKRFTRLTYAFSRKLPNLRAAVALHIFQYNFCRIQSRTKRTPAMAAGVTERLWTVGDLFG